MKNEHFLVDIGRAFLWATLLSIGLPEFALAQGAGAGADLNATATRLTAEVSTIPPFVSALFFIGGGILMGAGLLRLKEHAESPTQTPVRQGVARLAVGAALLTIPYFSQWAYNTLSAGTGVAAYTPFATIGAAP